MDEEIDLRDYINVLIKWKRLIIWITVLAMFLSGIASYFIIKPVYEASGSLLVNEKIAKINITSVDQMSNPLVLLLQSSVGTYENIIKSNKIEAQVLAQLKNAHPSLQISVDLLKKIINVTNPNGTALIKVTADYKDPLIAKEIVEMVLEDTGEYVNDLNASKLTESNSNLKAQFLEAKKEVESAEKALADFNSDKDNIEALSNLKKSYTAAITSYLSQLLSIDAQIKTYNEQLNSTRNELEKTDKYFILQKSILDDPLLSQLAQNLSNENIIYLSQLKVKSQTINPLYEDLKSKESNYSIILSGLDAKKAELLNLLSNAEDKVRELNKEINTKKLQLDELSRNLSIAKAKYSTISSNYLQTEFARRNILAPIVIADLPVIPTHPIKPKKLFNIAVSGVAAFFFAVLLAFFLEYWTSSDDKQKRGSERKI